MLVVKGKILSNEELEVEDKNLISIKNIVYVVKNTYT